MPLRETEEKELIKEAFGFGESIEEAKKAAIENLDNPDADYKIEIIEDVKPKVLGLFGGHPAQVRAFYECEEPKERPQKKAQKTEKKRPTGKQEQPKAASEQKKPKKQEETAKTAPALDYRPLSEIDENSPAAGSASYLINVLEKMDAGNISIQVADIENGAQLLINGDNLGVVIGRRGETLDALQYLASFAANANKTGGYFRIVLDIGNYREKREETLKSLAHKVAAGVLRTGRSRSLEPMNPYERRIIHTEIQDIEGVSSHSVGDGVNRHVVITSDNGTRRYDRRGGRNGGRSGGRDRDRRPQNRTVSEPTRAPRSDSDDSAPLYGRIG